MSKRGELLKMYSERGFSFDAMQKTGELLSDMTDSMKEEKAAQIFAILQESETEQDFISKMGWS